MKPKLWNFLKDFLEYMDGRGVVLTDTDLINEGITSYLEDSNES